MIKEKPLKKSHLRGKSPAGETCMVSFYGEDIEINHLEIEVVDNAGRKVGTILLGYGESVAIPFSQLVFRKAAE